MTILLQILNVKNGQISVCDVKRSKVEKKQPITMIVTGNLESQFILGKDSTLANSVTTDENGNTVEKQKSEITREQ